MELKETARDMDWIKLAEGRIQ